MARASRLAGRPTSTSCSSSASSYARSRPPCARLRHTIWSLRCAATIRTLQPFQRGSGSKQPRSTPPRASSPEGGAAAPVEQQRRPRRDRERSAPQAIFARSRDTSDLPPRPPRETPHPVAIPSAEVGDTVLGLARVGAGAIAGRVDAALVALDEAAVLLVRLVPHLDEIGEIVVAALDRLAINDPIGGHQRLFGPERQHADKEAVIA